MKIISTLTNPNDFMGNLKRFRFNEIEMVFGNDILYSEWVTNITIKTPLSIIRIVPDNNDIKYRFNGVLIYNNGIKYRFNNGDLIYKVSEVEKEIRLRKINLLNLERNI